MTDTRLSNVESPSEVRVNVARFIAEAPGHHDRALHLLRETSDWVHDPLTGGFAPSEFAGFSDMNFEVYEQAVSGHAVAAPFDGETTREAVERALEDQYQPAPELVDALTTWGLALLGHRAFGGADASKWRFISLLPSARNPTWERDELILALDLYFRLERRIPTDTDADVVALSVLLNRLPIHHVRPDAARFRDASGVTLKLANFHAIEHSAHGMSAGGKRDRAVWTEFANDPERLRRIAQAIMAGWTSPSVDPGVAATDDEDESEFPEGRIVARLHRARERRGSLVRRKKAQALRQRGRLTCEACDFSFGERYGALGEGYIECHHTAPLSELDAPTQTRLEDVVLVCSNCHRMIHRHRPWLSAEQVRLLLRPSSE